MKKEVRLYNVLLPVWLVILPGNLLIDCLVLTGALFVLKHRNKWAVVRKLWWKFWLLGFLADFVGVLWMVVPSRLYQTQRPTPGGMSPCPTRCTTPSATP